ncbi:glycoside hydrolase family 88/105 protein [Brenneria tiliae]|uniref:Glycoside hydrolase family 88 protein n=1 Tax=Brenneria tiliae TaxID=2914984 RepID=A0ABT0MP92_9GAMM|nr:glycoside hydrolase family 88 protein [Brenneria tiliae]MCL2891650.1 glycoside hydrolase family 88 protein [Brenneria tiliae]
MTVFPVKHNKLLCKKDVLLPKNILNEKILSVINNLINIRDETGEFLIRLDDGRAIDSKSWNSWEWVQGVGLYGLYQYYNQTNNPDIKDIMDKWFAEQFAKEDAPIKNVNTVCPLLTLAYLYEENPCSRWRCYMEDWAEWVLYEMARTDYQGLQHINSNRENHQQLWDDTLMMCALPLMKIGRLFNRPEFVEEAVYQFLFHTQQLMDKKTGLWFHGWTFDGNHNFAEALWARGNCWITMAIPDLLELLDVPPENATRRYLQQVLERQIKTLAQWQDESGLWHTLLDDPSSYLESSATAGFAYGILKAVRKRYISKEYAAIGEKAIKGILDNIDENGQLNKVSFGTAVGRDLDFYRNIPITPMPYGQSMAILALTEYLRVYI